MTVIIGFNYLTEIIMIADSRVSYTNNSSTIDTLEKLQIYPSFDKDNNVKNAIVIGFAGRLNDISPIMVSLNKKFKNYRSRFVFPVLKDKVCGWIEEAAKLNRNLNEVRKVEFTMCGVEPARGVPIKMEDGSISSFSPFPKLYLFKYTVSFKGENEVKVTVEEPSYVIIGSGKELKKEIVENLKRTIKFGFNQPNLLWARPVVACHAISELFNDSPQSSKVGGIYHYIRITPDGLKDQNYLKVTDHEPEGLQVRQEGSTTFLYNSKLDEEYHLKPVWEFVDPRNANSEV